MPTVCQTCTSKHRKEIEQAVLVDGLSSYAMEKKFGIRRKNIRHHLMHHVNARKLFRRVGNRMIPLSHDGKPLKPDDVHGHASATARHRRKLDKIGENVPYHLGQARITKAELAELKTEDTVLRRYAHLFNELADVAEVCGEEGMLGMQIQALGQTAKVLSDYSKTIGLNGPDTQINVQTNIQVNTLAERVMEALVSHPEAREAVAAKIIDVLPDTP